MSCINNHDSGIRSSITTGVMEFCGWDIPARDPAIKISHIRKAIHIVWNSYDRDLVLNIDVIIEYLNIVVFRYLYGLGLFGLIRVFLLRPRSLQRLVSFVQVVVFAAPLRVTWWMYI